MRGDVYRLKRPRSAQGHEQRGERYAVVVQASAYEHLSTWLVAPTTTKSFDSMIHPTIELHGQDVRVLVEQTTAVDPQRLGDFAGRLTPGELMEVNVALRAVLDLELSPTWPSLLAGIGERTDNPGKYGYCGDPELAAAALHPSP